MPIFFKLATAIFLTSSSLNSGKRADPMTVPPLEIISDAKFTSTSSIQLLTSPLYPSRTTYGLIPFAAAVFITALIAAFIPGASPPDVKTPIFFIIYILPPHNIII